MDGSYARTKGVLVLVGAGMGPAVVMPGPTTRASPAPHRVDGQPRGTG